MKAAAISLTPIPSPTDGRGERRASLPRRLQDGLP